MALTRGRAILQDAVSNSSSGGLRNSNHTVVVLGNSVTTVRTLPLHHLTNKKRVTIGLPDSIATSKLERTISSFANKSLYSPIRLLPSPQESSPFGSVQILSYATKTGPSSSGGPTKKLLFADEVDVSKFVIGAPQKMTRGKFIPLSYGPEGRPLRIQTPVLRTPFGVNKIEGGGKETPSMAINVSLDNIDESPEIKAFHDILVALDKKIVDTAAKNSKEWFDKDLPAAVLDHNYKRSVRPPKDPKYSPLVKFKVPIVTDPDTNVSNPNIVVWLNKEETGHTDDIRPNTKVQAIVELKYVWIIGNTFGPTWSVPQVRLVERPASEPLTAYSFRG